MVERCSADKSLITLIGSYGSISGSKFTRNRAEAMVSALRYSSLTLEGSEFIENTVRVNRATVVVKSSTCEVNKSRFENNTEGAIHVENRAALKVTDSYFSGNRAEFGGAILGMTGVEITISNTDLVSNTAGSVPPSVSNLPKQKPSEASSVSNLSKPKPTEATSEAHQHTTTRSPISKEETSPLYNPSKSTESKASPTPSMVSFLRGKRRKVSSVLKTAKVSGTMSSSVLNTAFRIPLNITAPSHVENRLVVPRATVAPSPVYNCAG